MSLTDDIKHKALYLGFDLVGVTDASPISPQHVESLAKWLKAGFAGRMDYMHRNFEKRIDPAKLLPNAQSVIVVVLNYKPVRHPSSPIDTGQGKVAAFAQYEDYHAFIKKLLRQLAGFIGSIAGPSPRFKICVDSAPLAERALAARAGLGFIAKNHMLINPALGPQIFLGEILTTLKLQPTEQILPPSESAEGKCSACNKCIDACPTGALMPDGRFDAGKCISYLTIEYKGSIPPDLAEKIADRLFGCDECVLACPLLQSAPPCKNKQFKFHPDRARLDLHDVLNLTADSFDAAFGDSVIKRLGLETLKRNANICLANAYH